MVTGTAKLVVDLGNSETRVKVLYGKTLKGNSRGRLTILSNRYAQIPAHLVEGYIADGIYSEEDSSIFTHNGATYCNGRLCETEFSQSSFRPSAMEKKYDSIITKLELINALHQGYMTVADYANCGAESLDIEWELHLLLPPEDMDAGAKKLADLARSITEINFQMPEIRKDITISSVKVYPEGLCAFIGTVFKNKGSVRPGYNYLIENQESTLICDVGAGTTDFVMVKGAQVISTSRFTREIGGNNVHRLVQRSLRGKGITLPEGIVAEGCETGYVMSGSRQIDITEEIASAKQTVSNQLVDAVKEFFESSMVSIRTIANILVVGGGAEISSNPAIQPISTYITEYIKRLSPDIKLVEIPVEEREGVETRLSARMLNINGASILAE